MNFNKVILPQVTYASRLETVNKVKFTRREIDIIAYLLSGKSAKTIASCLSISPKTIEAHMRNITMKIECNSRDGIIDFIESSDKLSLIKEHYLSLLAQAAFEKHLITVSKLLGSEPPTCVIVSWKENECHTSLIRYLNHHLRLTGIKTLIEARKEHSFVATFDKDRESWKTKFVLYAISETTLKKLEKGDNIKNKKIFSFLQKIRQSSNCTIALLPDINIETGLQEKLDDLGFVYILNQENYYEFFFDLLKKILPSLDLERIFIDFKKQNDPLDGFPEIVNQEPSQEDITLEKRDFLDQKILRLNRFLNFIKVKKSRLLIGSILGVGVFCTWFLISKQKVSSQNQARQEIIAVRTDLKVPTKSILLDRPQLMAKIENSLKGPNEIQTVALVGIGGAGKTTIARHYARKQNANVVWELNAESEESRNDSFESLADVLSKTEEEKKKLREVQDIKGAKEREDKIILFVRDKLKHLSNWLLIYDNVEKFTDIQRYFPHDPRAWGKGKVLVITRDNNIGNNNRIDHTIQIGELTPEEKLFLFTNIMNNGNLNQFNGSQTEQKTEFLHNIPPFPLDVSIAAYYLKATNVPYEKYLEHLKEHHKEFATVQENVLKEATDYAKTRYGIITLSLKNLMATHTDFRELLLFISLLDNDNIPRDLLNVYKSDVIIENFIYNLKKYSFVTNESPPSSYLPSTFSIHKSTQEIILDYLIKMLKIEKDNQLLNLISNTLEKYINNVITDEDLARMKLLVSHCENILKKNYLLNNSIKVSITSKLGYIHYYLNDYIKSQKLLEESLANLNEHASEDQAKIAYVLMYLGDVYSELGNHGKAKDLCERSLTIYKQHFPNDHVGVARALAYLGNVHRRLGEYTKARDLCEKSLEIYTNHFSGNPTKVAWALAHLGITYKKLKDYEKAKDLLEESLATYKDNFSENHPRVAWVLAHLGHVHSKLGNYEKAKSLLDHSLTIYNNNFSENHVRVAWVTSLLASVYKNLENYEKSKSLFERSLFLYEKNYGKNHIEIAYIVRSLGKIHLLTGQLKAGDNLIHTASRIFQQNKHPESYKSLEILANFYLKYAVHAQNTGDSQLSKRYKEQAIYYLNQTQKFIETHFSENSYEIIRVQTKIKELENENK